MLLFTAHIAMISAASLTVDQILDLIQAASANIVNINNDASDIMLVNVELDYDVRLFLLPFDSALVTL